jgi:hypothetical protein
VRSYVPLNKDCVQPSKGVKGFNGRFEWGHLKSIPDWYIEKLSIYASGVDEFCY